MVLSAVLSGAVVLAGAVCGKFGYRMVADLGCNGNANHVFPGLAAGMHACFVVSS